MPYNTMLEEKLENIIHLWDGIEIKKMFGGICYMINGNMAFGVLKDYLIVRMAPDLAAEKLNSIHVKEFDMTGRSMKGWIMVEPASWENSDELAEWIAIGRSFASSLPKKLPKRKSLEDVYYRNNK
jgi:TfoX/Sxy family transcriptional regulator of competence genes